VKALWAWAVTDDLVGGIFPGFIGMAAGPKDSIVTAGGAGSGGKGKYELINQH
jgi:hypothetical protein